MTVASSLRSIVIAAGLLVTGASLAADPAGAPAISLEQPLTLRDTIRLGVTQNLNLLSERSALRREVFRQRSTWQSYSPTLTMRTDVARTNPVEPAPVRGAFAYAAGVSWFSPIGTVVSAEAVMAHPLATVTPAEPLEGAFNLSLAQPLLKDAWLVGASQPLREAELQAAAQRELFRDALNATILSLETAYWDLAVAQADVEIKSRSRDRAQQQFEDTRENIRRGILADVEIYVPQENVVFFEQELLQARQNLGIAQRELTELLAVTATQPVRAAQTLSKPELAVPAVDSVIDVGLRSNPRLLAQRLQQRLAESRERFAVNQALPTLDLAASLGTVGNATRYGRAWGATLTDTTPAAKVGLVFALPLDRGAVDAGVQTARQETQRQSELLDAEAQRVRHEILDGASDLQTQLDLLALTEKQLQLAELKLQAETDKYKSGISTLTDVVRFQRDLDNASIRLRRVIRSVHVGQARLLASQGTLHDAYGIELK